MSEFDGAYAQLYSYMHADRDYQALALALRSYFPSNVEQWKFLDFGAGPGELVSKLCELEVDAYAYDISQSMYRLAKARLKNRALSAHELYPRSFSLVASLFDVISYQETLPDLEKYIMHLISLTSLDGSILIDGWSKHGVNLSPPKVTTRQFIAPGGNFVRKVTPLPSESDGLIKLDIQISNDSIVVAQEIHTLRAYEIREIEPYFVSAGFKLADIRCGSNWEDSFSESCWRFFSVWKHSIS